MSQKENEKVKDDEVAEENAATDNKDCKEMENEEVKEEEINSKEDDSEVDVEEETKENESDLYEMEREELHEYISSLEEKVSSLEKEKNKYFKKLQRLQADFNNYRNRTKREKESIGLEARIELVNEILPVIDNFERAMDSKGNEGDLKTGIEMIYKMLMNNLKSQGLEQIPTEGESFQPKYHEAIMQVDDCEEESGVIVEEMQKGYMIDDKVIRPAMVKVAK